MPRCGPASPGLRGFGAGDRRPAGPASEWPRPRQAPPRPAGLRARPGRCRRAWREIGKCFCARRRRQQFLRAAAGPADALKPSSVGPGPGAAGAARDLTPARLPLRAQPAGRRARRGPGRGDVSADARVSGAVQLRALSPSPGAILLHAEPCLAPILVIAPPSRAGAEGSRGKC